MFKCEIADEILRKEVKALQLNERMQVCPLARRKAAWCSTVAESCNFFLKRWELWLGFNRSHHCSSIVRCRQWYGHLGFTVESLGYYSLIGVFACLIWYNLSINHI